MSDPIDLTDDTARLDDALSALFAPVRPAAVEDHVIWRVRLAKRKVPFFAGFPKKVAAGVAATVALGAAGAIGSRLAEGELPMPGTDLRTTVSRIKREAVADASPAAVPYAEAAGAERFYRNTSVAPQVPPPAAPGAPGNTFRMPLDGIVAGGARGAGTVYSIDSVDANRALGAALAVEDETKLKQLGDSIRPPGRDADSLSVDRPAGAAGAALPGGKPGGGTNLHLYTTPTDMRAKLGVEKRGEWLEEADKKKLSFRENGIPKEDNKPGQPVPLAAPAPVTTPAVASGGEGQTPAKPEAPPPAATARKIIRSGEIEFEIESFDSAVATVTKLVTAIPGAFVGTVNSDKLPNGKVRGTIVVRTPPDALDGFVLDLRRDLGKGGELKGQKIGSQDVTKQYTDTESRLKAARTMETRLLEIIKSGKGEIKQLLEAERELGVWRTKIEEFEGELRYLSNQVSLSTLTITLAEKEIKAAAGITESERVDAGVEVEDVDKAFREAQAAVAEAKGRVTKSELKQLAAGQFTAALHFEVAPDKAGPIRDRLQQLGRVARLEVGRVQTADGGPPTKDAKVTRGDTVFQVQFYNLANIAPRETATLQVAVPEVPAAFQAMKDAVGKAKGRVLVASLDEQDKQNVTARFDFEVRRTEEASVLAALAAAGEVTSRTVGRAPEGDATTDSKLLYRTTLYGAARVPPRETHTLAVEVADADGAAAKLTAFVTEAKGRVLDTNVNHAAGGRVIVRVQYDVPLTAAGGVVEKAKAAGTVRSQQQTQDRQAPDGKYAVARVDVTISTVEPIIGKEDGLWPQVRKGLTVSASVLLTSVTWVVFGLCVVLPWAVVGVGGYRLVRRLTRPRVTAPAA